MKMVEIPEVLTDPQRPGILTTEFWLTLLGVVLTFFVQVHVLAADGAGFLSSQFALALPLVIKLIGIVVLVAHYVQTRHVLKVTEPVTDPGPQFLMLSPEGEKALKGQMPEAPPGQRPTKLV